MAEDHGERLVGLFASFAERLSGRQEDACPHPEEGLRQRKKRLMRQLISDTATAMFVERGFDQVPVAEVARACHVSEKTVFNYFPNKESLVFDRQESDVRALQRALGPGTDPLSPVEAAVRLIEGEVRALFAQCHDEGEGQILVQAIGRFVELVEGTPALRAAYQEHSERLVEVAARAMADRAGVAPEDPEPQIAAIALVGLWQIGFRASQRLAGTGRSPSEVRDLVLAHVHRAARLLDSGLWSFGLALQARTSPRELTEAAAVATRLAEQVVADLARARRRQHHPSQRTTPTADGAG